MPLVCDYPLSVSVEGLSIPDIRKSKLSRMWEASFLGQFDDLTIHLIGLPLHAPVDPVDLNLQAGGSKHSCGLLRPDDEAAEDEKREQIGSVKHVN